MIDCLDKIVCHYKQWLVVVVPGGGVFAEQVRTSQQQVQFGDRTAHCMAILAMQQMALLIVGVNPQFKLATLPELLQQPFDLSVRVWTPAIDELDQAGIASTWNITSDSLAVWLAKTISASQLLIVKSIAINPNHSLQNLADIGVIDECFCDFAADASFNIKIINAQSL